MAEQFRDINAAQLDKLLAHEQRCLLLLFWAPWNVSSRELQVEAERVALTHADEMTLVSINVDREIDLAMRHGLRSVPLTILFRQGGEVARASNLSGWSGLLSWLGRHCVTRFCAPTEFEQTHPKLLGAFHGDETRRRDLIETLRANARSGAIVSRRFPFWCDGQGTISGVFAGTVRPDRVEESSGLPFSFLCVLELLILKWSAAEIDAIFGEIKAGADLTEIAARLVSDILADPATDWADLIDDDRIDNLRLQWLQLMDRHVCGLTVAQSEWDEIVVGLGVLRSHGRDPLRSVQDTFIDMLGTLSPPPAHDDDLWVNALSLHGVSLLLMVVQHDLGWSREDFAFEGVRAQWFIAREQLQPGERFSDQALTQAQQQWMLEQGEAQRRYDLLLTEASDSYPLISNRIRQRLLVLLRESAMRI